jgi:hypothetical protein
MSTERSSPPRSMVTNLRPLTTIWTTLRSPGPFFSVTRRSSPGTLVNVDLELTRIVRCMDSVRDASVHMLLPESTSEHAPAQI